MARFRCEMFGHFAYDTALSYEDMLETEAKLISELEGLLLDAEAAHLDFVQDGDALEVQCEFSTYEDTRIGNLCHAIEKCLGPYVRVRILFVDKGLEQIHIYGITHEHCQCSVMEIMHPTAQIPLTVNITEQKQIA